MRNLLLIALFFCSSWKCQDLNDKKFYAQLRHSCIATTSGAYDVYTFLVMEFKNNKVYASYLEIPSKKQSTKYPVNYRFENKIVYLAKPLDFKEDLGLVFKYVKGDLIPKKKQEGVNLVFKPSLNNYLNKNK